MTLYYKYPIGLIDPVDYEDPPIRLTAEYSTKMATHAHMSIGMHMEDLFKKYRPDTAHRRHKYHKLMFMNVKYNMIPAKYEVRHAGNGVTRTNYFTMDFTTI
jgi:hypothetical protein